MRPDFFFEMAVVLHCKTSACQGRTSFNHFENGGLLKATRSPCTSRAQHISGCSKPGYFYAPCSNILILDLQRQGTTSMFSWNYQGMPKKACAILTFIRIYWHLITTLGVFWNPIILFGKCLLLSTVKAAQVFDRSNEWWPLKCLAHFISTFREDRVLNGLILQTNREVLKLCKQRSTLTGDCLTALLGVCIKDWGNTGFTCCKPWNSIILSDWSVHHQCT